MIYFIQTGGRRGPVKIGFSENDTKSRMQALKIATPYSLKLLGEMQGKQSDERRIHAIFKDSRIGGEWFKYTEALNSFIESSCNIRSHKAMMELITDPVKNVDSFIDYGFDMRSKLKEIEKAMIISALKKSGWVQSKACMMLGICKSAMTQKMKQYGIKQV